ncbi:MAG: NUDIX hydrolase [Bacteroidota bacterium]
MIPLSGLLSDYRTSYPEEQEFLNSFAELLDHPNAFERTHLPGHITGSAWILNQRMDSVALVLHGKLNRWMQPGGHADGDQDVLRVALREAEEETGLKPEPLTTGIWDLDIHPIPERKDFPAHLHYDVRFCFRATNEQLIISDESSDLKWIPLVSVATLTDSWSVLRMVEKSLNLIR